jgi:hypothetical protein
LKEGLTYSDYKASQKHFMNDDAKLAAGKFLETAHWINFAEVPSYLNT